jgi:Tfp pilus assembly protein PilO
MSRARGKEVHIITAVIVVVVVVAWFFLLYNPERKNVSSLDSQITAAQQTISGLEQDLVRLKAYAKTAPQTEADLLRLNKMMPSQTGIPSVIVELTQTAAQAGIDFKHIAPGPVTAGTQFSVQPINLNFTGSYYDAEDFLFRLESYVEYRNSAFLVTGRLLQVGQVQIAKAQQTTTTSSATSDLSVTVTLNAYLWSAQQSIQPIPASAASSVSTASPTPTPSGSPSP